MKSPLPLLAPFLLAFGARTAQAEFVTQIEVTQAGIPSSHTPCFNDEPGHQLAL